MSNQEFYSRGVTLFGKFCYSTSEPDCYDLGSECPFDCRNSSLVIFGALVTCDIEPTTSGLHMIVCMKVCPETKCHGNSEII